jgi:hypothetical protein
MRSWALAAALAAAALLPHEPPGADVPLVAALVAAAVFTGARRTSGMAVFGGLALALSATAAWLDARWVVSIDLAAACLLATVATAGVRLRALAAPLLALGGARPHVPPSPFASVQALRGLLLGSALVLPFGALFWTGDAAFAELGSRAMPSPSGLLLRAFVFAVVLTAALGLALAARVAPAVVSQRVSRGSLAPLEWAIPIALLDALFLAFVAVQLAVLFGGHDHVLETTALTYAEYARNGFWQLIAAGALTLAVVGVTVRHARTEGRRAVVLRDVLLGTLLVLTLVILASALHRLHLYEDAFGLTRSRLAAETFCIALAGFLALVAAARIAGPIRRRFAAVAVAGGAAALLAFSLSNPDARVARRNIDRWQTTGQIDVAYLQGLSADAVPVLATLPDPLRARVLAPYALRVGRHERWTSANVSRSRARSLLP